MRTIATSNVEVPRMRDSLSRIKRLQDLIDHIWLLDMPWRRGNINGLSILWQLGLDETLSKIDACVLPFHGRRHRHAASHSRQVRYGAESVCEVAFSLRHVLSLQDEAHLEPLNLQFVLSRRVSFDLVMEAGGDDPCAHGQFASLDLFQAAAPKQACHLVALLLFQIGANRSLRIAAPLCFGSGSVRSIHDKSWSALLASSCLASRSSARVSKQNLCRSGRLTQTLSCPSANHKSSH